jgi:hypothetical protein
LDAGQRKLTACEIARQVGWSIAMLYRHVHSPLDGGYGTHRYLIRLKFSPVRAMLHGTISQAVRQFL